LSVWLLIQARIAHAELPPGLFNSGAPPAPPVLNQQGGQLPPGFNFNQPPPPPAPPQGAQLPPGFNQVAQPPPGQVVPQPPGLNQAAPPSNLGLNVDSGALNELVEEDQKAAQEVIKRVQVIRETTASSENKTKFAKMKELFAKATAIAPGEFKGEVAFGGQCVSQDNPETFYPGLANLYVERDPVLGTQIYFVPTVGEGSSTDPDYANMELPEMRKIHQDMRGTRGSFTAMQFGLEQKGLSEILSANLKNSVLFTYRAASRAPAAQGQSAQSSMVLFNVRMDRAPSGRPYVIMQRLCPYFPGCKPQGNNLAEYLNYVEAFAYCYYAKMHFLPRGG